MPSAIQKTRLDRTLTRKAVKLALDDLKEKNAGVLLSAHAVKIRSYAPDLAKTIAGLILSSNDSNFQEECCSLLGLQCHEIDGKIVEECIKEQLTSVIDMNDRKPQRSREAAHLLFKDEPQRCREAAHLLLEDDNFQEPDFLDELCEEGEEAYSSLQS